MSIDSRLVDFNGADEERLVENFNRILALLDEGGGGSAEADITINAVGTYDNDKGEWSVDDFEISFGNDNDYDSIVAMLQDTSNMPTVAGGIKIVTEVQGNEIAITSLPTNMLAMDMGGGDTIVFTLQQPVGLGTIMGMLRVEDDEITLALNLVQG